MYDFEWHKNLGDRTTYSAETMVDILRSFVDLDAVLDVGCGDGRWLSVCRAKGAGVIAGVEGPWTDMARLLVPGDAVAIRNLAETFDLGRRFSLVISLEVAEHIAGQYAEVFIDNLIRHGDVILFGAAVPYQNGYRHINERWQSYWADLFAARGFEAFDPLRSQIWNDERVYFWYKQNALLYVNRANAGAAHRVRRFIQDETIQQMPLDIVHPEKYSKIASYTDVAFRPLMRTLPRHAARRLSRIVAGRAWPGGA